MSPFLREVLQETKALIATPQKWTQNVTARDDDGRACAPEGADACQWCLLGALYRVDYLAYTMAFDDVHEHLLWVLETQLPLIKYANLADINDVLGFEAVHQLLDLAIETTNE